MKWIFALYITLSSLAFSQTVKILTLEEALQMGKENNRMLRVSTSKMDAASARASEAHAMLLPSLKLEASYRRLSDVDPFQVNVPIFPTPITIGDIVLNTYATRVVLQQPLFTGFRLRSNARAAEYLAEAAAHDKESETLDVTLNVTNAYWMLYQTLETKKFADENVARIGSYEKDTENLMKAGMATRNDLLKIQVQLNSARLLQIDAANDVRVATMNLNNILSLPLETEMQLASSPAEKRAPEDTVAPPDLVSRALVSRPDLMAMHSRVEASKAAVSAAQGSFWPQLFLAGGYSYNRPNARYQPTRDQFKSSWEIGIQMQFDIWNWGATSYQSDQARASLQQSEYLFDQMKDNISLEVQRSYLNVQQAREKVNVARVAIEQAVESNRTTNDKYRNGLATSSEVLDASVALLQARTNLSGALVEYELASARMTRAIGGDASAQMKRFE